MIKKTLVLTVLTLSLSFAAAAQKADTWKSFKSAEGKFSVNVPCTFEITSEDLKSEAATTKQTYLSCVMDAGVYSMSFASISSDAPPKLMLDKFRDGVLTGSNSTRISEKDITLLTFPGREMVAKSTLDGIEIRYEWRIYVTDKVIYSLSFISSASDPQPASAQKFLSSFALEK